MGAWSQRVPPKTRAGRCGACRLLLELAQHQERPLATIKDAAYAWRQADFFLSLIPRETVSSRVQELRDLPSASKWPMSDVIGRLAAVVADDGNLGRPRPFLGWSVGPHWVLSERPER